MAKKKTTRKLKVKPSSFSIGSSILNRVVKYFKFANVEDFMIKTYAKEKKIMFAGVSDDDVAVCSHQIYGINDLSDVTLLFELKKLEKALKTLKSEIVINHKNAGKAILKSGKVTHIMALKPTDTAEFKDFVKNAEDISDKYPEYENYYKCTIIPKDFADVIAVGSTMDFSENMYFGDYTDTEIKVSLVEGTQVDESDVDIPTFNVEVVGEPEIIMIHPKFIKVFEIFDTEFELVLPADFPIRAESRGTIGDEVKHEFKTVVAIATKLEVSEEDTIEEAEEESIIEEVEMDTEPKEEQIVYEDGDEEY